MTHGWDIKIHLGTELSPVKGEAGASGSYTTSSSTSQSSTRTSGKSTKTKKIVSSEVACQAQPWETKTCYIQSRFRTVRVPWTATEQKVYANGTTTTEKINGWKTTLGHLRLGYWPLACLHRAPEIHLAPRSWYPDPESGTQSLSLIL